MWRVKLIFKKLLPLISQLRSDAWGTISSSWKRNCSLGKQDSEKHCEVNKANRPLVASNLMYKKANKPHQRFFLSDLKPLQSETRWQTLSRHRVYRHRDRLPLESLHGGPSACSGRIACPVTTHKAVSHHICATYCLDWDEEDSRNTCRILSGCFEVNIKKKTEVCFWFETFPYCIIITLTLRMILSKQLGLLD